MITVVLKKIIVMLMVCNILVLGMTHAAEARFIGTQETLQMNQRVDQLDQISTFLIRSEVQEQMLSLGVKPENIQDRLSLLTDEELRLLANRLQDMPAGGDSALAIIGIVFVVLIILELVGVTNIFTRL